MSMSVDNVRQETSGHTQELSIALHGHSRVETRVLSSVFSLCSESIVLRTIFACFFCPRRAVIKSWTSDCKSFSLVFTIVARSMSCSTVSISAAGSQDEEGVIFGLVMTVGFRFGIDDETEPAPRMRGEATRVMFSGRCDGFPDRPIQR